MKQCRVKGYIRRADGSASNRAIDFRPERGGPSSDGLVTPETITIEPGDNGLVVVKLTASSVVGDYTVTVGGETYSITVPDDDQADLGVLLARQEGGGDAR